MKSRSINLGVVLIVALMATIMVIPLVTRHDKLPLQYALQRQS
ncbi:hypothetical protein [Sinorhizobium sp. BG8]|nr:hypothetical protein [Sinorhizobium sp. BG8]